MPNHTVTTLRVRTRCAAHAKAAANHAAPWIAAALESAADAIDRAHPGVEVHIRDFHVSTRARAVHLDDAAAARRLADALAETVGATIRAASNRPGGLAAAASVDLADTCAIFADEPASLAAALKAAGTPGHWFTPHLAAARRQPDFATVLLNTPRPVIAEALSRLDDSDNLHDVLARLPSPELDAIARSIVGMSPAPAVSHASPRAGSAGAASALIAAIVTAARAAPPRRAGDDDSVGSSAPAAAARKSSGQDPSPVRADDTPSQSFETSTSTSASQLTRCAGLFYYLNLLLELDAGAILWRACLPERVVIARAIRLLTPSHLSDDPALAAISGSPPTPDVPVSPEQADEALAALAGEFARAIPRRGLASFPSLVAHAPRPAPRAVLTHDSWVVAASIVPDASALTDTLVRAGWPPALIVASTEPSSAPPSPDQHPADLIAAALAGAVRCLAAARYAGPGRPPLDVPIEFPARLEVTRDETHVHIDPDDADPRARRAGLDRDPGDIPWLGRRVRLLFDASGPDSSSDDEAAPREETT